MIKIQVFSKSILFPYFFRIIIHLFHLLHFLKTITIVALLRITSTINKIFSITFSPPLYIDNAKEKCYTMCARGLFPPAPSFKQFHYCFDKVKYGGDKDDCFKYQVFVAVFSFPFHCFLLLSCTYVQLMY